MKKLLLPILFLLPFALLTAGSGKEIVLELQQPPAEGELCELTLQTDGVFTNTDDLDINPGAYLELVSVRVTTIPGEIVVTLRGRRGGKVLPAEGTSIGGPHGVVIVGIDNITGIKADNGGGVDVTAKGEGSNGNNGIEGGDSFNPDPKDEDEAPIIPGQPAQNAEQTTIQEPLNLQQGPIAPPVSNENSVRANPESSKQVKGDVSIVPNPANEQTDIVTVGEILMRGVQVYDQSGKPVTEFLPVLEGDTKISLDLRQFKPGLYIVMVHTTTGRILTKKLYRR